MAVRDVVQAAAGAGGDKLYVEDVFSTYLYTGTGATQTITNGIDLDGEGGMVWIKQRDDANPHVLFDTERGVLNTLHSNQTSAAEDESNSLTSFNANGFTLGSFAQTNGTSSAGKYASWTFRKAPKFFDVVTWTGTGSARTIAHALGAVPGCIIVKRTDTTSDWQVYHRANTANPETDYLVLNSTAATADSNTRWNDTLPTDAVFSLGTEATVNASGGTYVAYLFAHDAGGFGDDGEQNVISCGSYTGSAGNTEINLGWEPQWVMIKKTDSAEDWGILDVMRGLIVSGDDVSSSGQKDIFANTSSAEATPAYAPVSPQPNGFKVRSGLDALFSANGATYIYIAIRRGPMATPTSGTEVFGLNARTGTGANATVTGGQTDDAVLIKNRGSAVGDLFAARLTGTGYLVTSATTAEVAAGTTILQANPWDVMDGVNVGTTSTITNASGNTFINYLFKRAPGFFDVVAYTGNGPGTQVISHNLGAAPELSIFKARSGTGGWTVYNGATKFLRLNENTQASTDGNISPTSTTVTVSSSLGFGFNASGITYIAYLFASCPGVSKVGSYTGTGTTLAIDCGFSAGARFVLIKRTDSTGDWYVWDTARGIVSGNDPYLLLNSTAAEVTSTDYIDPSSAGFEISSTAPAAINASGGSYIFLAIA